MIKEAIIHTLKYQNATFTNLFKYQTNKQKKRNRVWKIVLCEKNQQLKDFYLRQPGEKTFFRGRGSNFQHCFHEVFISRLVDRTVGTKIVF